MNKLISILAILLLSNTLIAQSNLELRVFEKINEYRDSLGLKKLECHNICHKGSELQSNYLLSNKVVMSHTQDDPELETPEKRYLKAGGVNKHQMIGEVCSMLNKNYKISDINLYDKIANEIVNGWRKSKEHNNILTSSKLLYGGISIKLSEKETGVKSWRNYESYSVMLLVDKK
jgi:uncharacterized protein YkwD